MDFLKKLNEEYRLFYIDDEDHSIEEVDLEDILDQGPPEGYADEHGENDHDDEQPEDDVDSDYEPEFDPESDEDEIDFSQFDDPSATVYQPEPIPDEDDGEDNDLDYGNVDDHGHGMDGFQNPETKGEKRLDKNLTGLEPFKDEDPEDPSTYDTDEFHYPSIDSEHLGSKNTSGIDTVDAYNINGDEDDQYAPEFDDSEDYSDILGDMDIGSYLAKYAGHGQPESGDELGGENVPEESMDQGEEGLEGDDQGEQDEEDPDFQGVIRTVQGACLAYKRLNPNDNTYSELWVFTSGDDNSVKAGSQIRRAILAGTDINPSTGQAGSNENETDQTAETTTVGNVTFVKIDGLPS